MMKHPDNGMLVRLENDLLLVAEAGGKAIA
jgi:hypothetical protein